MSYLDSPRIHFRGWFQADVSTINNDVRFFQNDSFVPEYQQLNTNGSWNPRGTAVFRILDCSVTGGFLNGRALGPQYDGDLFVGAARTTLEGGYLFHFNITGNRQKIGVDDPRLEDRVADNNAKFDITESESLLFGRNFGVGTDVVTGPNGNLYVVSLDRGVIYEVFRK